MLRWFRQPGDPAVEAGEEGGTRSRMFLTTRRFPVYYLPITKCGCTYLKNLFYYLDHDREHPSGNAVHESEGDLMRADALPDEWIRESRFAFTVVRDPVDRFLSLYFDKIWGDGPQNFPDIRTMLAREEGLDLSRGLDAAGHVENCFRLLSWLGENLAHRTRVPVNPHWKRQSARLRRAADLKPVALTLDGLDWQLPAFLGPAIPDLRARMQMVRSRNASPRPVPREAVAVPRVVEAVRALYPQDDEAVTRARQDWARRQAEGWENVDPARPRAAPGEPSLKLVTTHRYPVHFMPVPKAGCTWLRNLFYQLDHGHPHPDPLAIQADEALVREQVSATSHSGRGFIVLRDPVARFFSLYFDKVVGTGPHAFPWIAERLAGRRGFHRGDALGAEEHRENCRRLMGFIAHQIGQHGVADVNAHWRPQTEFAARARSIGLCALTLEGLETQLPAHLGPVIPDLPAKMAAVERNRAHYPVPVREILNGRLESLILDVYGPDRELHQRVASAWASEGRAPPV